MEESEEDQDPVLAGYMTFLKKALKTLPDGLRAKVKAKAGAEVLPAPVSTTPTAPAASASAGTAQEAAAADAKSVSGSSTAATKAVSAVAAAAGQLVGGMWGAGRAARGGKEEEDVFAMEVGGGHGLVRELVERCLFSLPQERGDVVAPSASDTGDVLSIGGAGETGEGHDDGVRGGLASPYLCLFRCYRCVAGTMVL